MKKEELTFGTELQNYLLSGAVIIWNAISELNASVLIRLPKDKDSTPKYEYLLFTKSTQLY